MRRTERQRALWRAAQARYRASDKFKNRIREQADQRREYMRGYIRKWKSAAMAGYSEDGVPRCACCGLDRLEFLCIDHVFNDGHIERKATSGSGVCLYRRIVKAGWPATYQPLCYNCNCAKAFFGGECPHKTKP